MNFRLIKHLARKILLEERPKVSLGAYGEEDSGFCRYNAKINEYAADSPENLAEVLIFCVASQLVDWPNIYTRFPYLINWIYAHNGIYPKDAKMIGDKMEGGFPKEFSPITLGEKAKSINAIWKNKDSVFTTLSPIIRRYKQMKEGEAKEQAAFELYLKLLDMRHLKLAKAGFAVQLLIGRYGCIDSINTKLLKVPMPAKLVKTDEEGKPSFRDYAKKYVDDSAFGVSAEESKERLARLYADYLLEIGRLAKDNESKVLWDKWCDIVAAKINFAGKEFEVTDPQDIYKDTVVKSDYAKNVDPTTPPASFGFGPGKKEIAGPEVSRQHAGLYRGLRDISENKTKNKLKSMILEQLLEMLKKKKQADKSNVAPKLGSKSRKKVKEELDETSAASGMAMGYAAPMKKKVDEETLSEGLQYHINNNISLCENVYRPYSEHYLSTIKEARNLYKKGKFNAKGLDKWLLESTDVGEYGIYEGKKVPLDMPFVEELEEVLMPEDKKKPSKPMNQPFRSSGPKKYAVYVRSKSGGVKKVNFGDVKGGLTSKITEPAARKSFVARHKCTQTHDKTTAGYWACRLPRYAERLGLAKVGAAWW